MTEDVIEILEQTHAITVHPDGAVFVRINDQWFQVDQIKDTFQWKSAILWGNCVELSGEERQQAMQGIIHRIMPLTNRPSEEPSHGIKPELHDEVILFKIELTDSSGKYETHDDY